MLSFLKFLLEQPKNSVVAGVEFSMTFKEVYKDLKNNETKALTAKIEGAVSSTNVACFS